MARFYKNMDKFLMWHCDIYISSHLRLPSVIFPAADVDVRDVDKPWELGVAGVSEGDGGGDLQPAVRGGGGYQG